jgi:RNA polymerase sigma-70 factor (ECF subfamily)
VGVRALREGYADGGPPEGAAGGGDFVAIYRAYFAFVWRCLRALGVAQAALDDAAQEVFVVVHRRLPEFRGDASLRTWLYAIVRNVAANQRRGAQRGRTQTVLDPALASPAPSPLEHVQEREAAEFVRRFARALDDKKRDVFVLALLEQLAIPEVAETLGIPLNTAYTRLRSVRAEFRRALQQHAASNPERLP